MKFLFFVYFAFVLTSCATNKCPEECLASISIINADGISETISNESRLKNYEDVDFLSPQPYKKVLRVYKRNSQGAIEARLTSYHPNGELKQYLDVVNGRAHGQYCAWHENGSKKIEAHIIGGIGDVYDGVENSWIFDGNCQAFSSEGYLEAEIPYVKGYREGTALYYHKNGAIWKEIPLQNDRIHGTAQIYLDDGTLFEESVYIQGKKEGPASRYWKNGKLAFSEQYEEHRLMEGSYFAMDGSLVSQIICGNGFKAIFDKESVHELQEHREGIQEGLVKVMGKRDHQIVKTYGVKNGLKHGDEIEFYPNTMQPKFSIGWIEGKIQGLTRTWYPSGKQESQREMANNKRAGVLTAWYVDGTLLMLENYDQDLLVKGEYFKMGEPFPVSRVICGEGIATIYDANGLFLRKINYRKGKPDL